MARTSALSSLSVSDLQREIARRERTVAKLARKRSQLARKLAAIDSQIAANGGMVRGGRTSVRRPGSGLGMGATTRAANGISLQDALAKILKTKTMGVTEVSQAVQKAGYTTHSPNFRTIVNATLIKHKKMFKRVGRGQYTVV